MDDYESSLQMKKRKKLIITAIILLAFVLLITYDALKPPKIDYYSSELYTKDEIKEAVDVVKAKYKDTKNKLISISYAGDYRSLDEMGYYNKETGIRIADCIVLRIEYRSPFFGDYFHDPNKIYSNSWVLVKDEGGTWIVLTSGQC